jgi:hypothetical protein
MFSGMDASNLKRIRGCVRHGRNTYLVGPKTNHYHLLVTLEDSELLIDFQVLLQALRCVSIFLYPRYIGL